jgi:hypothetical protein
MSDILENEIKKIKELLLMIVNCRDHGKQHALCNSLCPCPCVGRFQSAEKKGEENIHVVYCSICGKGFEHTSKLAPEPPNPADPLLKKTWEILDKHIDDEVEKKIKEIQSELIFSHDRGEYLRTSFPNMLRELVRIARGGTGDFRRND